jgi:hypothetical protein
MAAKGQNFEIFQGDTKRLVISVQHPDGSPYNLTGYSVRWVIYFPTTRALLLERATSGGGITVPVPTNGEILIDLVPTDTENAIPRIYNHECEIQTSSTNVHTVCVGIVTILYSKA